MPIHLNHLTVSQRIKGQVKVQMEFEGYLTIEQWDKVQEALGLDQNSSKLLPVRPKPRLLKNLSRGPEGSSSSSRALKQLQDKEQ